ncbi:hypothetical protein HDZ31DRAFT_40588 [Schizophyllum fasciatum]
MAVVAPSPLRYIVDSEGIEGYVAPPALRAVNKATTTPARVHVPFQVYERSIYRPGYSKDLPTFEAAATMMLVKSHSDTRDAGHLWYARKRFSWGKDGMKQYLRYRYHKAGLRKEHARICYELYMFGGQVNEADRRAIRHYWGKDRARMHDAQLHRKRLATKFMLSRMMKVWMAKTRALARSSRVQDATHDDRA